MFAFVAALYLCGGPSHGHRTLGARHEPMRGAAQGEPGRTRKGQRGGSRCSPRVLESVRFGATRSGQRTRSAACGQRPAACGQRHAASGTRSAVRGTRHAVSGRGQRHAASGKRSAAHGTPSADAVSGMRSALVQAILRVDLMVGDNPEIDELDLNPLIALAPGQGRRRDRCPRAHLTAVTAADRPARATY